MSDLAMPLPEDGRARYSVHWYARLIRKSLVRARLHRRRRFRGNPARSAKYDWMLALPQARG